MNGQPALAILVAIIALASRSATAVDPTLSPDKSSDASIAEYPITPSDRDHWSYQAIVRPTPPKVDRSSLSRGAIDDFVLQELQRQQLAPMPPAERGVLLRRLTFDLLGLPPTPEELSSFERDRSPAAYQKVVDRLLASPAYGERWAQHWLDLARFAETDGFEHDRVRAKAWQYRQWVIDALNHDMPYDEFIRLQLTGDQSGEEQDAIPTMFCLAGPDMPDINEQDLRRHDKLNEITSTVGAVLLGFQMHCCQCHDHKYDPISQADFYRLRGIFESAIPELQRDKAIDQLVALPAPVSPHLYYRGELSNRGPRLDAKPPRIACSAQAYEQFDTAEPRRSFAKWLFAADNPLTVRVIANRIWQHHFGASLCENPSDFGLIASGPSHPELLDWLASELREHSWSMKQLHRTILMSATYQRASYPRYGDAQSLTAWEQLEAADPSNQWYGRFSRQRLEGEIIRDALLAVSGELDHRYGGPSVMPPLPPELLKTLLRGQWQPSPDPADHVRRSVYLFARRNLRYPIFEAFDRPDAGASCARRDRSTTAIQSLQMLNGDLAFQAATKLRDRLLREARSAGGDASAESQIEQLFLMALDRRPTESESSRLSGLLTQSPGGRADQLLIACVAVLNSSEFIYID